MIRRFSVFFLTLIAIVTTVNIVCQAESQTLLTSQVREAVLNGHPEVHQRRRETERAVLEITGGAA